MFTNERSPEHIGIVDHLQVEWYKPLTDQRKTGQMSPH